MAEGLHRDGNGKKMNNDGFGKGTASGNGSTGIGKLGKV
jgi:hypothetical protein